MSRDDAIPGGESGDAGQSKPDADFAAEEEDPRLTSIRAFLARDTRRRQRRRRLIGICTVVAGAGLVITVVTAVGRRTQHQSPVTSHVPAPVVREDRAALGEPTGTQGVLEEPSSLPKRSMTAPEPRRLPQTEAAPSRTASARGADQNSRGSMPQQQPTRDAVYQPLAGLTAVRRGDTKQRVFETFATSVERRNGTLVRIEGIRLRARGRSPQHDMIEIADVRVADAPAGSLRWFLFGDGRLLAWGRAEEWATAAERYQVETEYKPAASPDRRWLHS